MMHATAPEAELVALYQRALGERLRRHERVAGHADALAAMAHGDPLWIGRARVLQAFGRMYAADLAGGMALAESALQACIDLGDVAGEALARDAISGCRSNQGDLAGALAVLEPVWSLPERARSPIEWCCSHARMTMTHERLGQHDDALRWHYRGLAWARRAGDPAYLAYNLGAAGGLQLSLHNLDDAASLCEEAWRIVSEHGLDWPNTFSLVATNHMMVTHFQGRNAEALALADAITRAGDVLPWMNAPKRALLLAMVYAGAGHAARAQPLLDDGLQRSRADAAAPVEWSATQARLHNDAGRPAQALAVCQAFDRAHAEGRLPEAAMPSDRLLVQAEAARAHEALEDLPAALQALRQAQTLERELVGAATRARRLTLQIRYELDEALHREREGAREQARLADVNAALAEADAAKSRFLAAASHDLRQPIHALGLQLAHLRTCGLDDEARSVADRMGRALGALTTMFDALLDISRMDAGVVQPRRERVALRPLLARLAEECLPLAGAKGLRLALRVPARAHAESDPALLESMLRNLLGNALKYTLHGGVLLALRQRDGQWHLQVWDTGPGIAEAEHERVFEEFYQVGNPSRDRSRGLGLGLAITRRLARLLGHGLRLDSRPGHGTRFSITLEPAKAQAEPAPLVQEPVRGQRLGVAIVEDDAEVRESLAALLRRWGHDVIDGDCADAVLSRHAEAGAPRLQAVIADYRLRAQGNGEQHARRLQHTIAPDAEVLIVTGDTAPERLQALAGCGLPWLSKPVQPARLRSWLASLDRPREP